MHARPLWTPFSVAALLGVASAGSCVIREHDDHHHYYDDVPPGYDPPPPVQAAGSQIDPGEHIETTPGEGAGVFVEYESGGAWHVFLACDSEISGYACVWDLVLSVAAPARLAVEAEALESDDLAYVQDVDQVVRVVTTTDYDFDGVWLTTDPGETLRIDALLDGYPAHKYLYWVSGGGMHRGAPTNPLDLTPTAP
jgi:hypothetical protein